MNMLMFGSCRHAGTALLAVALLAAAGSERAAQADALDLPRFASIRATEVNMRTGPGSRYPVEYVYRRSSLPVQIIAEFDTWRRIRDVDGDVGWVHQSMLSGQRTVFVLGPEVTMMRSLPSLDAGVVARLERGVIAELEDCENSNETRWCRVESSGHSGWIPASGLWGVSADD